MIIESETVDGFTDINRVVLSRYGAILLGLTVLLVGYLLIEQEFRYLYLLLFPVFFVAAVSHARFAVYQYLFLLFTNIAVETSPFGFLLVDISAVILICTAVLDFLLKGSRIGRFPALSVNFGLLLVALFVVALLGPRPFLAVHSIMRLILTTFTFLAFYRLSRYFTLMHLVKVFFWFSVIHCVIALLMSLQSGHPERVFGLAPKTLDDLTMISFPVGLALYLWLREGRTVAYLLGSGVIFVALLATQSRLAILLGGGFSFLVVAYSLGRRVTDRVKGAGESGRVSKKRTKYLIGFASVAFLAAIFSNLEFVAAVINRFSEVLRHSPGGTFSLRLLLWDAGLNAFWDNPIIGIGPGNFRFIHEFYPSMRFHPDQFRIEGLTAHNLVIHYLAETGIVGSSMLIALLINQLRKAVRYFKENIRGGQPAVAMVILISAIIFFVTAFLEAGWMWGQTSLVFAFFMAIISKAYDSMSPEA
ncbi:MAG: O-antigen ligase family protein [Candidatus Zixiibacteriota bacterium]